MPIPMSPTVNSRRLTDDRFGFGEFILLAYHFRRRRFARPIGYAVQYWVDMTRPKLLLTITAFVLAAIAGALGIMGVQAQEAVKSCDPAKDAFCYNPLVTQKLETLELVQLPKIATPTWMSSQAPPVPAARVVTYTIATKGNVQADFEEFKSQVNETLNSPLGWSRLGVRFARVEAGGEFAVWLSESSQVPTFSPSGCDAIVSCTVGNNVIINETRWLNGSDAWNGAGGELRNYRHMVVNHETGHWLGHGHEYCGGAGQDAPVMQQQTINMQGCKPNPWPQAGEMYAPKLGIRS